MPRRLRSSYDVEASRHACLALQAHMNCWPQRLMFYTGTALTVTSVMDSSFSQFGVGERLYIHRTSFLKHQAARKVL